jgi:serine/threonine protein kinase
MTEEEEDKKALPFVLPDVSPVKVLGKGAQGSVVLVKSDKFGLAALKYSRIGKSKKDYKSHETLLEAKSLNDLGAHPHLIKCLGTGEVTKGIYRYIYVLLELHQGDLEGWNQTRARPKTVLQLEAWKRQGRDILNQEEPMLRLMALQIASALDHMQKQGYIHRDIKPLNMGLLWDDAKTPGKPRIILCDFGFTRKIIDEKGQFIPKEKRGFEPESTMAYASPGTLRDVPQYYIDDAYNLLFSLIRDHYVPSGHPLVDDLHNYDKQAYLKDEFMKDPERFMGRKVDKRDRLNDGTLPAWLIHLIAHIGKAERENAKALVDYKEALSLVQEPEIPQSPASQETTEYVPLVNEDDLFALSSKSISSTPQKKFLGETAMLF